MDDGGSESSSLLASFISQARQERKFKEAVISRRGVAVLPTMGQLQAGVTKVEIID